MLKEKNWTLIDWWCSKKDYESWSNNMKIDIWYDSILHQDLDKLKLLIFLSMRVSVVYILTLSK